MNKLFEELAEALVDFIEEIEEDDNEQDEQFCDRIKREQLSEMIINEDCSLSKKIGKIVKFNLEDLFIMDMLITVAILEEPAELIIEMSNTPRIKEFLTKEHKDSIIDLI